MPRRKLSAPPPRVGSPNWANQTIWTGDNLDIMRGMNSASVDLIYLDPPFNSNHNYAAPIGSKAAGAAFKDTWGLDDINLAWHGEIKHEYPGLYSLLTATREIHGDSMMSYLIYMSVRLMEMRRILTPVGSIYLHCDPTASHYLKLLLDATFGKVGFLNEIIWCYSGGGIPKNDFPRKHDVILRYARSEGYSYNPIYRPYSPGTVQRGRTAIKGKYFTEGLRKEGTPVNDWWMDVPKITSPTDPEKVGYPTQKPIALLSRIIRVSSNPGEVVMDPFCGCATACIAAEIEGRQWVGIDIAPKAADLVRDRLKNEVGLFYQGAHRTDIPTRTDIGKLIPYNHADNRKYLYGEQGGYCNGCEEHFPPQNLTVDHIIPKSKGGTDHISNLQLLCSHCNSVKGDRPHEYLLSCLTDKGWIKRKKAA